MARNPWGAPPPRWLTKVEPAELRRSDGDLYADIIDATCRITKDSIAGPRGQLLVTRPWQRQILKRVFARRADGLLRHRTALIGIPRKNGKSELAAGVAIGNMLLGPMGGQIFSCAADKEQASIIFSTAKQMIEMDEHLSALLKVYRSVIEVPTTGTTYKALSAEAFTKEGLNPTLVLFDELHAQPTRELWDVMRLAMGARVEPLLLAITTAGVRTDRSGLDSICYSMYQHGVRVARSEVDDPTFFMAWWEPRAGVGAPHREPTTWREANPGFNDIVGEADFRSVVAVTPENEFRIKRTNQWVASGKVWLPHGSWDEVAAADRYPDGPPDGAKVCIGLDGSSTGDSTVLIGVTVEDRPHVFVVGVWEKDPYNPAWKVPRAEVKEALRVSRARWDVVEEPWDPYLWQDAAAELRDEGHPIEDYPQTAERMGKATQAFYESVTTKAITHDGSSVLARHVANAVPRPTQAGFARITKETPDSPRKIDAAVCAVFTLDRALWWAQQPVKRGPRIW